MHSLSQIAEDVQQRGNNELLESEVCHVEENEARSKRRATGPSNKLPLGADAEAIETYEGPESIENESTHMGTQGSGFGEGP